MKREISNMMLEKLRGDEQELLKLRNMRIVSGLFIFILLFQIILVNGSTIKSGDKEISFEGASSYSQNGLDVIEIKDAGYVIVDGRKYSDLKTGSKLYFKNGKLVEAELAIKKDSEYVFNGKIVEIPKDSKANFKEKKLVIELPDGSKIKEPKKTEDKNQEELTIEYKIPKKGAELPNEKIFKALTDENSLFYDTAKGNFYIIDKGIDSSDMKSLYEIGSLGIGGVNKKENPVKLDLFFDDEKHEGNYVSFSENKFNMGSEKDGFFVKLKSGNEYVGLKGVNTMLLNVKNGYLSLENNKMEVRADSFAVFLGNDILKYNSKDGLFKIHTGEDRSKVELPGIQISIYDKDGKKVYDDFYSDDKKVGFDVGQGKVYLTSLSEEQKDIFSKLTREKQLQAIGMEPEKLSQFLQNYDSTVLHPTPETLGKPETGYQYPSGTLVYQKAPLGPRGHVAILLNYQGEPYIFEEESPNARMTELLSYKARYGTPVFEYPEEPYYQSQVDSMLKAAIKETENKRKYDLQNKGGGLNCATYVGQILGATGLYPELTKIPLYAPDFSNYKELNKKYRIQNP